MQLASKFVRLRIISQTSSSAPDNVRFASPTIGAAIIPIENLAYLVHSGVVNQTAIVSFRRCFNSYQVWTLVSMRLLCCDRPETFTRGHYTRALIPRWNKHSHQHIYAITRQKKIRLGAWRYHRNRFFPFSFCNFWSDKLPLNNILQPTENRCRIPMYTENDRSYSKRKR